MSDSRASASALSLAIVCIAAASYQYIDFLIAEAADIQPLFVPENTGIRVVQGTVASVGNIGFNVIFEAVS